MGEETDLVVHQLQAHPMIAVGEEERQVTTNIHGLGAMLEANEIHGVSSSHIQFRLFSYRSGIEIGLHCPIMTKGHIVLGFNPCRGKHQYHYNEDFSYKHTFITSFFLNYC